MRATDSVVAWQKWYPPDVTKLQDGNKNQTGTIIKEKDCGGYKGIPKWSFIFSNPYNLKKLIWSEVRIWRLYTLLGEHPMPSMSIGNVIRELKMPDLFSGVPAKTKFQVDSRSLGPGFKSRWWRQIFMELTNGSVSRIRSALIRENL